ncbi:MAG: hypothetical protein J7L16_08390 [Deltaproteobacteria bacterium]|nr:hypothetical protein [Deltaproteobacteria bacterium]
MNSLSLIKEPITEDDVFIIGAGHFGARAARILSQKTDSSIFIVDLDKDSLSMLDGIPVKKISCDAIPFLVKNYSIFNAGNIIVPAVPVHLAYEWLKGYLKGTYEIRKIENAKIFEEIKPLLPYTWPGSEGSLLVSYADFICPDDCPEPEFCSVTGERRDNPLYNILGSLKPSGFKVHVIRSHQLAPGLGGYRVADLTRAEHELTSYKKGRCLLGTSCRCHGILTALEIKPVSD